MPLSPDEVRVKKQWLKDSLKKEFNTSVFSVGVAAAPHDFAIRVMGAADISYQVNRKVKDLLPQSNPDVRYINYIKPL